MFGHEKTMSKLLDIIEEQKHTIQFLREMVSGLSTRIEVLERNSLTKDDYIIADNWINEKTIKIERWIKELVYPAMDINLSGVPRGLGKYCAEKLEKILREKRIPFYIVEDVDSNAFSIMASIAKDYNSLIEHEKNR